MTRQEFIKLVKTDVRTQTRQVVFLMGLIFAFGLVVMFVVDRTGEPILRQHSPELWLLLVAMILVAASAVVGLRLIGKALLRCPHCRKRIGGVSSKVVVACGRCVFCGERVIDEN